MAREPECYAGAMLSLIYPLLLAQDSDLAGIAAAVGVGAVAVILFLKSRGCGK